MASSSIIANVMWWLFFIYYAAFKYLVALQSWDAGYAVQVAILVLITAFVPYYLTRLVAFRFEGALKIAAIIILPLSLCAAGYAIFYYTRIQPFFEGVSLQNDVMPRSFFPGLMITGLLLFEIYLVKRKGGTV